MKRTRALQGAILTGGLLLAAGMANAGMPSAEALSYTCAGCHGPNGVSEGPATPTIAGMSNDYFIDSMKDYREGTRASTIMTRIAKGYTDEEITAMAGYFSKQEFVAAKQMSDADAAAKGAKLHDKYCEKCHAEGGTSAEDDSGILKGQWSPYIEWTMVDFMAGTREMPKKMKKKVNQMNEKAGDEGKGQLLNFYKAE